MTATAPKSLIGVLNACDNFRPHLSPEPLVPFLLAPNVRPALGLLRPAVVAAQRADNAWRIAHGHPLAWDIPASADTSENPLPCIAFATALANGTPAARTQALAETLERWRAAANGESAGVFSGVIGGTRWRAEWYDVYLAPGGALRVDGRDPLSVLEMSHESGYIFSMERSACALFGVITYGVHMTVYERDASRHDEGESQMRVWVPRRALTKPTCVCNHCVTPGSLFDVSLLLSFVYARARVKFPWYARQFGRGRYCGRDVRVGHTRQGVRGRGELGPRTCAEACTRSRYRELLPSGQRWVVGTRSPICL